MIKSILVPLDGSEQSLSTLTTALAAARRSDAHLDVLHVRIDPRNAIPYLGEGMSGALVEEVLANAESQSAERASRARRTFESFCSSNDIPLADRPTGGSGVTAAWTEITGREDEIVAMRGRISDLVVFGRPSRDADTPSEITLDAALLDTGRPLLMAPPGLTESLGIRISIFWRGSAEAARAIGAALPFLLTAEDVLIMTAPDSFDVELTGADLQRHLAWHGVQSRTLEVPTRNMSAGKALLDAATDSGSDLLVMGAYTHSRVRQMILGGVTSHVVANAPIPVLMEH